MNPDDISAPQETPAPEPVSAPAVDWSHFDALRAAGQRRITDLEEELSTARNAVRRLTFARSLSPGRIVRLDPANETLKALRGTHVRVVSVQPDPEHGVTIAVRPLDAAADQPGTILDPAALQLG